ncbi:MAG: acetylglutamate kinase [Verrucomicrobia bacterium]|nr:acetylglutamate kinase [Verrucomicrobiota bacterium]
MNKVTRVIVLKYGGSAMEDSAKVAEILAEIAGLAKEGWPVVLVHGGGKEISGEMKRRGLKGAFVEGFRVTDEAAMAVVEQVLDGKVNPGIVAKLNEIGGKARGISGRKVFQARKAPPAKADGREVDLVRVGEVERCEVEEVQKALAAGETAVVSPVAQGNDGGAMNLNADVAAAALAGALQAEQLIFLSDVPGLLMNRKDSRTIIPEIRSAELEKLEKEGVISGGMIPKCRSAASALRQGLKKVELVDGRVAGTLTGVVKGQEKAGTVLTL